MEAVIVCSESVVGVVKGAVDLVLGKVGGVGPEGACVALCSMGEDCVKEGMLRKFGVEVLEAVFVSSKPSLVVSTAQAEEVLVVELCVDVFGDFPVDVVAVVGEAESWGGMGVRDGCDCC